MSYGDRHHWELTVGRLNISRWCSGAPCGRAGVRHSNHPVRLNPLGARGHGSTTIEDPYDDQMGRDMAKSKPPARGYRTDQASSAQHLSPQKPYTGDGKTTRSIYDVVKVVFRKGK